MKFRLLIFLLVAPLTAFCQLKEQFDDGDFIQNPTWEGDSSYFFVNPQKQLQSKGPASNTTIYLSFPSSRITSTSWEFLVKLPYQPSTTNFAKVYLSSDIPNLKGPVHGYFIKIGGESGTTDGIDLYKQNGTSSTKLIDGVAGHAGKSNNILRVRISRDLLGNWNLYSDTTGGYNFLAEGIAFDTSFTNSSFSGVSYTHTSTRRNQFYFDDFLITEVPVKAIDAIASGPNEVMVIFNKTVDSSLVNPSFYLLGQIGSPSKVFVSAGNNSLRLLFEKNLPNGSYILSINALKDSTLILNQSLPFYFKKPLAYGDLLISEIYPDPTPSHGLPEEEFIELYNNTSDTINLKSLKLSDQSTSTTLPDLALLPNRYVILTTSAGLDLYRSYGLTISLNPWPSLNNDADNLSIKDEHGSLIYQVNYSNTWFNSNKSEGGWSLEMINFKELCKGNLNWSASINHTGGSPGIYNSVYSNFEDQTGPTIISTQLLDPITIEIQFDEPIDSIINPSQFSLDGDPVRNVEFTSPTGIKLELEKALHPNVEILVKAQGVKDCIGNKSRDTSFLIIRPDMPDSLDMIINELLFNPKVNGYDFVEIYNKSRKILDLMNWKIQSIKDYSVITEKEISKTPLLIRPNEYRVFTHSTTSLQKEYLVKYPENCIELDLPSFNDDKGTVRLVNSQGQIMDQFYYYEELHSPLLKDVEGVSLERLSFFIGTDIPSNWYSASTSSGYGTPGYANSQMIERDEVAKEIEIKPTVITPNGDNHNDMAFIHYHFPESGNSITIKIFTMEGRLVKAVAQNQLAGTEGFYFWDGTNDKGGLVEAGLYIVWADFFNPSGSHSTTKHVLTIASDF